MSKNITISVPISREQDLFLRQGVKSGRYANKAHLVRRAITKLAEDEAMQAVFEAEREISAGIGVRGDLKKLLKSL
ncbi:MAG: hypothetical protein WD874_00055 [Parcubacteria group bacterium]